MVPCANPGKLGRIAVMGQAVQPRRTMAMLVDVEIRERLSHYCTVTKQTQEKAANLALREMLERCEEDPTMKAKMDRVKAIKEELASI
jgi:hypothetical protein